MKFNISIAFSVQDNFPQDKTLSYDELKKLLTFFSSSVIQKDKNSGFIAGHFNKKQRLTDNLASRSLITLDVDNYNSDLTSLEAVLKRDLADQWYIAYSTSSHSFKTPKIRIVILLDKEISTLSYKTTVLNYIEELNLKPFIDIDASTKPNQLMYLPARSSEDYEPWFKVNKGELLNPNYYIVDYGLSGLSNEEYEIANVKASKNKVLNKNVDNLLLAVKNKPLDISIDKIKETLDAYKAKDTAYKDWVEVGMALAHQFEGATKALQMWYDWSKLDTREDHLHRLKKCKLKWPSFGAMENPIKFSTIMKKVQDKKVITYNKEMATTTFSKPDILRNKFIHTKGKNQTPISTIENFRVLLKEYNITIEYDVILKRQIVVFDGVAEEDLNKAQTRLESYCAQNCMPDKSVGRFMLLVEKQVNTWRDFVESKPWDGVDRFNDFCNTVKVSLEHERIRNAYLRTWLMQMIHLTCLNDAPNGKMGRAVLVFQSNQWGGKTSWFKALCPDTHQRYLEEGMMLDTKDHMSMKLCIEHVFVELGELGSTFKKSDADSLKNFISKTTDMLNIKHLPHHKSFRRRTVFFGSVNDLKFLQDPTGNTRYLCLPVIECNYTHDIDMQQLYAQLFQLAKAGEGYYIEHEYLLEQKNLNSKFENESYLQEKFITMFDTEKESRGNKLTVTQLLEKLGFLPGAVRQTHMNEMSRILTTLGYTKESSSPRRWFLPPFRNGF